MFTDLNVHRPYINPNDNQYNNRRGAQRFYTIRKQFTNDEVNQHTNRSPQNVVGENLDLKEIMRKDPELFRHLQSPGVTQYQKLYGIGEMNRLNDPDEGGKKNFVNKQSVMSPNFKNYFTDLAAYR